MKVLLSWLREFAPLDGSVDELGDVMSDLGMAVESIERVGESLDGVVVARVLALREHPKADRIQLVDVDAGDGEALQIACGAFNMREGDLVPLATLGTVMPNGMEIARRKMRGEWSNGMLCAAEEIGMAGGEGIMILPPDLSPGVPLTEALGVTADAVYDLEINPNRPDAMSVAGVARDLAARLGVPFTLPAVELPESGEPAASLAAVEIVDTDLCGRFVGRVLRGVTVGQSPPWLASRLALAGMRPINSVVDASNYVMLELGQPNHAYDLGVLGGRGLRVRRAKAGETLVTLDDVERSLTDDDLLICDADDAPVGIAGIMGGASSEISHETTDVLLESAWFLPMAIARTSKRLGLRTEASARFERGCDIEMAARAADRFCQLVGASTDGVAIAPGCIDERGDWPEQPRVRLRTARLNAVLGTDLDVDTIRRHLDPIGFTTAPVDGTGDVDVVVPTWRPDSASEIDVIEEVARHHGYSRIVRTVPSASRFGYLTSYQRDRRLVREILVGAGLDEAWNLPFLAPDDVARAGLPDDALVVTNPLAVEESRLRTSLLPGMLRTIAYNLSHRNRDISLFEIAHVFRRPSSGQPLPDERELLSVALAGREAPAAAETWAILVDGLSIDGAAIEAATAPGMHPGRTAAACVGSDVVGHLGEVDPAALAAYGIDQRVAWLEVDLGALLTVPHGVTQYRPISRYPSSDLDLAFAVDDATPAAAVLDTLRQAGGELLVDLQLFEVYRGRGVEPGTRSLNVRLRFQAADRTLTDDELTSVRQRCIEAVERTHAATLRA